MDGAQRDRLVIIFEKALKLPQAEQAAYLDRICGADAALRRELASLLAVADEAPGFFEALARDVVDPSFTALAATPGAASAFDAPGPTRPALARYQILEKLGGGGMGVVYKARDLRLGRMVALKFLPHYLGADEAAKARFIHEAKAVSALDHPGIAVLHEIGETDDGQLFISMAYYEGETLKEMLARGPLRIEKAVGLACQLAAALAAAHEKGIVHRDVKPANVLVSGQGVTKLVDFGAAKITGSELTKEGMVLGTVAYMSPEQTRGEVVDQRTDIWSLGVVLYEMLTGQRPFRGGGDRALIHAIRHDRQEPLRRARPELPVALASVLEHCLAKKPAHRYQHIGALLADLESVRAGRVIERSRRRRALPYVGIVALMALIFAGVHYLGQSAVDGGRTIPGAAVRVPAEHRLAVLPFDDRSPDPAAAYFADGLTEELIARLSKLGGLRVIARASVMLHSETDKSIAEMSRALNVQTVLEGSVRKVDQRVRITVRFIDAEREEPLWSKTYEAAVEGVATVQQEIAESVAEALGIQMRAEERLRLAKRGTENPEAYELNLRGRYFWNKRDVASLEKSKAYFEQALDLDPTYAQAWTGLANAYTLLGSYAVLRPEEAHPRARAAANQALALDEELAEAHNALAATLADYYYDWEGAGRHFIRALELDPSNATAHQWYATNYLQPLGRLEDALEEVKKAQALDPLSPVPQYAVGQALYFARRYDEAKAYLQRLRELYPDFPLIHLYLAQIACIQGRQEEAVEAAETAHALYTGATGLSGVLGYVYAVAGRHDEARMLLGKLDALPEELHTARRLAPFQRAYIYIGLGEHDRALAAFEQAYEHRVMFMSWLGIEPIFDPLRSDPRFQRLLEKMRLVE